MSAFYMNEAKFDLPDTGFVDRTVTYLVGKSPHGIGVQLFIERRPLENKSLREAVDEHGRDLMTRYLGYSVLFERDVEVDSLAGIDVGARWSSDDGVPAYTRRIHLRLESTRLIVTGEVPLVEREFCDAYVNHVVGSLKFRG